jgi:hypothetical protein
MHPEFGVPADRAMLVSLMKSGTHLIQELMVALGYGMYGSSRIEDEIRPKFDRDTKLRTARLVLGDEEFMKMRESTGEEFERAAEDAWGAYGWAWQLRLGLPLENRYGSDLVNRPLVRQALARTVDTPFSQSPKGVCWVVRNSISKDRRPVPSRVQQGRRAEDNSDVSRSEGHASVDGEFPLRKDGAGLRQLQRIPDFPLDPGVVAHAGGQAPLCAHRSGVPRDGRP